MLEILKNFFVWLSSIPKTLHAKHWYNPPEHHAWEYLCVGVVSWSILLYALRIGKNRQGVTPFKKQNIPPIEHAAGVALITCLTIQTYYNFIIRPYIGFVIMLHPCHIITAMEIYLIYGKNPKWLHIVFNLVLFYSFMALLTLLFPDTSVFYLPYHINVFWTQHLIIYALPYYFVLVDKFAIDTNDWYYGLVAISTSTLFGFNVELVASLATSVNVNYTLWPPASQPSFLYQGPYYRSFLLVLIAFFSFLNAMMIPKLGKFLLNNFLLFAKKQKTN